MRPSSDSNNYQLNANLVSSICHPLGEVRNVQTSFNIIYKASVNAKILYVNITTIPLSHLKASLGSLLEMQVHRLHPRSEELETVRWGPDTFSRLSTTEFGNRLSRGEEINSHGAA